MKLIPLSQGLFTKVDDADFEELSRRKWSVKFARKQTLPYAVRVEMIDGRLTQIYMHRQIIKPPAGKIVDHRDGDGLNNMRSNLRACSKAQNQHNRRGSAGTSKFKGVSWHGIGSKWQVHIVAQSKRHYLGLFNDEIAAARAYDAAAKRLHGAFARPNFPEQFVAASPKG